MTNFKNVLFSYDQLSLTTHYLRIKFSKTNNLFATATGFIYQYDDTYYLITNAHNITRVNPETNSRICNHAGFPDVIETTCNIKFASDERYMTRSSNFKIDLYNDDDFCEPTWYMHPKFGYNIDVIAIPITSISELKSHIAFKAINSYDFFDIDFPPEISDDVFVLGYPFDIVDKSEFPIWKKGSIATEPMIDLNSLPKLLIDTATRSGMSGSPVIYQRDGLHIKGNQITDDSVIGRIRGFLGIYSGRIGAEDNFKAQLGIVWKKSVIDEILKEKMKGDIKFQNI
jgi:hypothetical protein